MNTDDRIPIAAVCTSALVEAIKKRVPTTSHAPAMSLFGIEVYVDDQQVDSMRVFYDRDELLAYLNRNK